ncbi:hypothetical protein [Sphingomonas sp.]|uniref:hypothetical protein n=1 Tax=Sphingomonas sp. TaxID=28214 RepID=UPI002DBD460B|nr:hypothetical protein [Sphingomonas sp.]HEU4969910.1 hypothetical protein [Sphingomonas sp.]
MSFTPEFWLILGLTLVLGWVLGLMSRSGGARWKRELAAERDAHAATRREYEARIAEADKRAAEHDRRIAEYERARTAYRDEPAGSRIDNLDLRPGEHVEVDADGNRVVRPIRP